MATVTKNNRTTQSGASTSFSAPYIIQWAHNVSSNADRALIVWVAWYSGAGAPTVDFNGSALTQIDYKANGSYRLAAYQLVAPDSGSHNITVTFSARQTGAVGAIAIDYYNVNQASPIDAYISYSGSLTAGNTFNHDITTNYAGSYIIDMVHNTGIYDLDPNQTSEIEVNTGSGNKAQCSRLGVEATPDTYTMSWTNNSPLGTSTYAQIIIAIKASGLVTDERDAEVHGVDTTESERAAETDGGYHADDERAAEMLTQADIANARDAETHGQQATNSARSAELTGQAVSERAAEVHGKDTANDARDAEITGVVAPNLTAEQVDTQIHLSWTYSG